MRHADGLHFTEPGYELLGDITFNRLLEVSPRFRATAPQAPESGGALTRHVRMSATALRLLCARCLSAPTASVTSATRTGGARSGAPHPAGAGAQRTRPRHRRWSSSAGFTRRLADLEAGRLPRLTILQIGDSHTEAEHFSGRLRALFQARFGNAGRGMLAPGAPVAYWRPYQVRAQQSGKWQVFSSNKTDHAAPAVRIVGLRRARRQPHRHHDAAAADDSAGFDTVEIGYYRRPDGGTIDVTVDGKPVGEIATRGDSYALARKAFRLASAGRRLEVRPPATARRRRQLVDLSKRARRRADEPRLLRRADRHHGALGLADGAPRSCARSILRSSSSRSAPTKATRPWAGSRTTLKSTRRACGPCSGRCRAPPIVAGRRRPTPTELPKYCKADRSHDAVPRARRGESADYDELLRKADTRLCRWHTPGAYDRLRARSPAPDHLEGSAFCSGTGRACRAAGAVPRAGPRRGSCTPTACTSRRTARPCRRTKLFSVLMQRLRRQLRHVAP